MSETATGQIAVVGLSVMGRNLALNLLDRNYRVVGYARNPDSLATAIAASDQRLQSARTLEELVPRLEQPRKILLMVKAGAPVDDLMQQLQPLLSPGDILIDGGNSWYLDTRRREAEYAAAGLRFMGLGVSGGEDGARFGPALMPGGDGEAWQLMRPIFEAIAAKTDSGPCVTHCGPDGAGHFVKMVHNGIEYADMQFIAEAYDILSRIGGLDSEALAAVFADWNETELESFLIDISAHIFTVRDGDSDGSLLDAVLDQAGQKGTGRWTAQVALDLGVPTPSISASIDARVLSSMKPQRLQASRLINGPKPVDYTGDPQTLVNEVRQALYCAKITAYAQGMALLDAGSREYGWDIALGEIARIWRGGCIIRARFLDTIMQAYGRDAELSNLLLDKQIRDDIASRQGAWRKVIGVAQQHGIPVGCLASSLCYFDSFRSAELPQNLTQAQRDAFGAHLYQRKDDPDGEFVHSNWLAE